MGECSTALLPVKGVRVITYMVTSTNKLLVLSVLCSLLNTVRQCILLHHIRLSKTKKSDPFFFWFNRPSNITQHHGVYPTTTLYGKIQNRLSSFTVSNSSLCSFYTQSPKMDKEQHRGITIDTISDVYIAPRTSNSLSKA